MVVVVAGPAVVDVVTGAGVESCFDAKSPPD